MNGRLKKTKVPGVYARGNRYVVTYRDRQGRQHKKFARTLSEARDLKATLRADVVRGEHRQLSSARFDEYAREWIHSYGGRTSRGLREETREDYRTRLEQDAIPFFGSTRLCDIEPQHIKALARKIGERGVRPNTVRLQLAPLKALMATAHEEGDLRVNPCAGLRLAQTQPADTEEVDSDDVKALADDELARLLVEIHPSWRLFFEFLVHTGLRISEAIELRWADVDLERRRVSVRRRYYRGKVRKPKSRYGRRDLRLTEQMGASLRDLRDAPQGSADDLVFKAEQGGRIDQSNLMARVLKPAAVRAGLGQWVGQPKRAESWVGFHTFRHTCATMLFRNGWNGVQVQRWLGHHKASFTIDTYVHLLDGDISEPSFFDERTIAARWAGGNKGATRPSETGRDAVEPVPAEAAFVQA